MNTLNNGKLCVTSFCNIFMQSQNFELLFWKNIFALHRNGIRGCYVSLFNNSCLELGTEGIRQR